LHKQCENTFVLRREKRKKRAGEGQCLTFVGKRDSKQQTFFWLTSCWLRTSHFTLHFLLTYVLLSFWCWSLLFLFLCVSHFFNNMENFNRYQENTSKNNDQQPSNRVIGGGPARGKGRSKSLPPKTFVNQCRFSCSL
jgi:hypothetical protein